MDQRVMATAVVAQPLGQGNFGFYLNVLKTLMKERWIIKITTEFPLFVFYDDPHKVLPTSVITSSHRTDPATEDKFTQTIHFDHFTQFEVVEHGKWVELKLYDTKSRIKRVIMHELVSS